MHAVFLAITLCILEAQAATISLSDGKYPYLYNLDPLKPIMWHKGAMGLLMASSEAVRVNSRGIRFISGSFSVLTINSHDDGTDWVDSHCQCSRNSMCTMFEQGGEYASNVFPNFGTPAKMSVGTTPTSPMPDIFDLMEKNRCPEASTGRSFLIRDDTSPFIMDVSLCNVVGSGGDFVFLPHKKILYAAFRPISFQIFTAISILTVFMVIILSRNLEISLGSLEEEEKNKTRPTSWPAIACMAALLLLCFFATGTWDVLSPFITMEDRFAFITTSVFVVYYILRIFAVSVIHPINPVLGTLVLVSMR